jgi:glycosyltransferase involved in cell wall biosynthesis
VTRKQLIFVVAYQAEAHIPELFERIGKSGLEATHDILLIDDASQDKTAELASRLAGRMNTKVTVLRNPSNLGYGGNQNSAMSMPSARATRLWFFCTVIANTHPSSSMK